MSITRGHWSDAEKKAVLDCYHAAADADGFFYLLTTTFKSPFASPYPRRTAKAYLTYLNEVLLPKTDPRRPVYQSLCDLNQKEIAARKTAEEAANLAAAPPPVAAPVLVADGQGVETPAVSDTYNWVEAEVDVVPRVPPGRVAPPSLFRDPNLPTLNEAMASQAAERATELAARRQAKLDSAQALLEAIAARVPEFATSPSTTACVLLHTELTEALAVILKDFPDIPVAHRASLRQRIDDVKACIQAAYTVAQVPWGNTPETARRFDGATRFQELLATDEGRETLAGSMIQPIRGTAQAVSAEPVAKSAVRPDPTALAPRHYPALPPKAKLTANELAHVFSLHRTKVVDAFAYGFIQTLDGTHISYQTAQRIHDAMSEGHSFSEACRQVNPNATGLLPMEALIEKVYTPVEDQEAVVVPNTEAGAVTLKVHGWEVSGRPLNPRSVDKMANDLNTQGPLAVGPVEVLSGPPTLFQGGEVFPFANPVETPAEPAKEVVNSAVTPGGASFQYAESTRVRLDPVHGVIVLDEVVLDEIHETPLVPVDAREVQSGGFERYTLEAVHDGFITTAQGLDILQPRDTNKAVWALSLLASGKITVTQCDRILFAKTV
jgi:hypothetical protein